MGLFRKIGSLLTLLRNQDDPWGLICRQARINLRKIRVRLSGGQPFAYRDGLGVRFACLPKNERSLGIYLGGLDEDVETEFQLHWVRAGDTALDGGANYGTYAAVLAHAVGAQGRVIAIEPSARTVAILREHMKVAQLPMVEVATCCLGESEGVVAFAVDPDEKESNRQHIHLKGMEDDSHLGETMEVPMKPLDSLVAQWGIAGDQLSFVKLDLEGAEVLALKGARRLLEAEHPPAFQVELGRCQLQRFQQSIEDVLSFFPAERFEGWFIDRSFGDTQTSMAWGEVLPATTENVHRLRYLANAVFIPRSGRLAQRAEAVYKVMTRRIKSV